MGKLHTFLMIRTMLRFGVAGFLAIIVTVLLLFLMRHMLGGFADPEENYFTNLFSLRTVILPKEHTRPTKPPRVQIQPDLPELEGNDVMQESEDFLSSQKLTPEENLDISIQLENPINSVEIESEDRVSAEELQERREKLISILEGDEE